MPNVNPPLVSVLPQVVAINGLKPFKDMFTVSDPDVPSEVLLYRFRDNGLGGGRFQINGGGKKENEWHEVTALQLSSVSYRGASNKSQETYSVQVYDGLFWSNVATGQITTGNSSPVLTVFDGRVAPFEKVRIDKQFSVFDADGDSIVQYQFIDLATNTNGGHFLLRGQRLNSGEHFIVAPGDLASIEYRGGQFGRQTEQIGVQVFDGFSWSEEKRLTMATTAKTVVTAAPIQIVANEKRLVRTMFNFNDPDGDTPFAYSFVDRRINADGGYFENDGQRMASGVWFNVLAKDVGKVFYVGGATGPQSENIGVLVFDGFEFSNVVDFVVDTLPRPVVSGLATTIQANHYLNFATGGKANTIGVVDPNARPILTLSEGIEKLLVVDRRTNPNGGYFVFKGARVPSAVHISVDVAELNQLEYRGGLYGPQSESIGIRGFANGVWSTEVDFTIGTLENKYAPELTLFGAKSRLGTVLKLEGLVAASDRDKDLLKTFSIYDTGIHPNSGYFSVNGVRQQAQNWLTLAWDQLNTVNYHMPTIAGNEKIRMVVSDGFKTSELKTVNMQAIATPVIVAVDNDIAVDTLEGFAASNLIRQTDGGPNLTRYEVFDENFSSTPDRTGRLFVREPGAGNNGEVLQGGVVHTLSADQFSRLELQGAEVDNGRILDGILIRATNDLTGWSEWQRINVNTDPQGSDTLISGFMHNAVISGNKTVITYTFIDGGNQSGGVRGVPPGPNYPPLPLYYPPGATADQIGREALNTRALGQAAREMHREVFEYFESIMNVDFVEVPYELTASQASMVFGAWGPFDGGLSGAGAYAYYPIDGDGRGNPFADVWYNLGPGGIGDWNTSDVGLGSYFRSTAFHEIGHALGLRHPFEGAPALSIFNNFDYNTVMAYNHDAPSNPFAPYHEQPSTMMLYDLVELQRLYGANADHNPGNDQYFYSPNESHQTTLWDGGGFDTINMTNHTVAERIDLREGSWTTVNGVPQSLRIAYGTQIEAARGGSGNDILIGNETGNLLWGNGGNDTLRGGGGNDTLRGGAGDDTYIWSLGDGRDSIREEGSGGTDVIEIYDPSGAVTALEDDFIFRRFGSDLRIDLTLNQGEGQGSLVITDFQNAASQVEKLRLHGFGGTQIGGDIDLASVFASADTIGRRYRVTSVMGANGFLATRV